MYNAPKLETIEHFLNVTRKMGVKESYEAITDHSEQYRNIKHEIYNMGVDLQNKGVDTENPQVNRQIYETKDEMLAAVKDFFSSISTAMGEVINKVLDDPEIHENIKLQKEGYCTAYTTLTSDNKINMNITITPTADGMVTLAQELSNAYVLYQSVENKREENSKVDNMMDKSTNMMLASVVIDRLIKNLDRDNKISSFEKDTLKYRAFKELEFDIHTLGVDKCIFEQMYESYPDIFSTNLENFNAENFIEAMEKFSEKADPTIMETINKRVEDIAYGGKTSRYIQGEVAERLAGIYLNGQFHTNGDIVLEKLLQGITNHHTLQEISGMTDEEIVAKGPNLVKDEIAQTLDEENEAIRVLEMTYNNSNNNQ